MITYQDYENAQDKTKWLQSAINKYRGSAEYRRAVEEQEYMAGRNVAILKIQRIIYDMAGIPMVNFAASNHKIRNRAIHRLVTDRCSYSLGNGVSFAGKNKQRGKDGKTTTVDPTKAILGDRFDRAIYRTAYWALSNGESFLYVHKGHDEDRWEYNLFKKTEFLPLYDEKSGRLRGGIRFWSLEWGKRPINAILYTEEGHTRYETPTGRNSISALEQVDELKPYMETVTESEAYGEEVIANTMPMLPIFPLYSGENRSSALDCLQPEIDASDMVLSGFCNDINDIAQVYWLVSGAMGMNENDKRQLLDRLILQHMAVVDGENSKIEGFTQEIPYAAREKCLKMLRDQMYEKWGGFDVHTVEAGATNDHIDAAYWPMDEEADSFEYELIEMIQNILKMMGIEDVPQFKRNKVSNQMEQTQMVMLAADALDEQTILEKLPWITVDEVDDIMARMDGEALVRFEPEETDEPEETEEDGEA